MKKVSIAYFKHVPTPLPEYHPLAKDYFSRADAAGGLFGDTGISFNFTELYVKAAVDRFLRDLDDGGLSGAVHEVGLFVGVSFDAALVKLKYTDTSTLTEPASSFSSDDHTPLGDGAKLGLKGNGANKSLDATYAYQSEAPWDVHLGLYVSEFSTSAVSEGVLGGFRENPADADFWVIRNYTTTGNRILHDVNGDTYGSTGFQPGTIIATSRTALDQEIYNNGVSMATASASWDPDDMAGEGLTLFGDSAPSSYSNARIAMYTVGRGMETTQVQRLDLAMRRLVDTLNLR